jgi:hypothetical protein
VALRGNHGVVRRFGKQIFRSREVATRIETILLLDGRFLFYGISFEVDI